MTETDRYAVFGHPIKHSKSPRIHRAFAEQTGQSLLYTAEEVPADQFETTAKAFFSGGGKGLNCTVPLKELAWRFADRKTPRAHAAKAVNTLALQADGTILGDNTDGVGLVNDLTLNHSIQLAGCKILILGAGGAARGILGPLIERKPQTVVIANRTAHKAVDLARGFTGIVDIVGCGFDKLADFGFDLILNATSASLTNDLPPLPSDVLADNGICYDLAYANEPTAFVNWGLQHNAWKSLDGLGMLVEQAAEAFYIWRGIRPETTPVIELLNSERLQER
ncbi:MAG: shikimate dehydrogenase [Gammaproteobacteria bacterium]